MADEATISADTPCDKASSHASKMILSASCFCSSSGSGVSSSDIFIIHFIIVARLCHLEALYKYESKHPKGTTFFSTKVS